MKLQGVSLSFLARGILQALQSRALLYLEASFFPEPRLLADQLLSGNSLIVGVCK